MSYWLVFFVGVFCGGLLVWWHMFSQMSKLWKRLKDYYYYEHIYPLLKTNRYQAVQRELAWQAFEDAFRKYWSGQATREEK